MTYRAGVVKVPRIPPKYSWKDPLQGFIYASSPSCLTILNILINKALMRHRHQVWLSIIIQMPKVWLWSEEWCVAQSPAWRFGFCICARVRIPVKKQCFSVCVAYCKIHAWKTLRKEVYCGIAVLVIAKFAAHLCCVCFFYFFFLEQTWGFLIQGIRNISSALNSNQFSRYFCGFGLTEETGWPKSFGSTLKSVYAVPQQGTLHKIWKYKILLGPVKNPLLFSLPEYEGADESVCNDKFKMEFENRWVIIWKQSMKQVGAPSRPGIGGISSSVFLSSLCESPGNILQRFSAMTQR